VIPPGRRSMVKSMTGRKMMRKIIRWEKRRTISAALALALLPVAFACFPFQGFGLASRDGCENCHTDKIALKGSLDPLFPRSGEEGEES